MTFTKMICIISRNESNHATTAGWFSPNPKGYWCISENDLLDTHRVSSITDTELEKEKDSERCFGLAIILD